MTETPANKNQTDVTAKKSRTDRIVKSMFALAAICIVGWMIGGQYMTPSLPGWGTDFDAAMDKAKASNSKIAVLLFDSPQDFDYRKLHGIIKKPDNVEAMKTGGFVGVQVRGGKDGEIAQKYSVTSFPTTILLNPDGTAICKWHGYIGEVDFRSKFLAGLDQRQ